MIDLAAAARDLALEGFAVFPCDGNKQPCIRKGCLSAMSDPDPAYEMFRRCRNAEMIGVATGAVSGIVVIDFDPPDGIRWFRDHIVRFPPTRIHRTRRGGFHLLYASPEVEIHNSAGKLAKNVDVRGWHGYVVFPPTPGYTVHHHAPISPMPPWIIRRLTRKPKVETDNARKANKGGSVESLARFVSRLPPGTRNSGLFWAAARVGEKVSAGMVGSGEAYANLAHAVQGWEDPEKTLSTLQRGIRVGAGQI